MAAPHPASSRVADFGATLAAGIPLQPDSDSVPGSPRSGSAHAGVPGGKVATAQTSVFAGALSKEELRRRVQALSRREEVEEEQARRAAALASRQRRPGSASHRPEVPETPPRPTSASSHRTSGTRDSGRASSDGGGQSHSGASAISVASVKGRWDPRQHRLQLSAGKMVEAYVGSDDSARQTSTYAQLQSALLSYGPDAQFASSAHRYGQRRGFDSKQFDKGVENHIQSHAASFRARLLQTMEASSSSRGSGGASARHSRRPMSASLGGRHRPRTAGTIPAVPGVRNDGRAGRVGSGPLLRRPGDEFRHERVPYQRPASATTSRRPRSSYRTPTAMNERGEHIPVLTQPREPVSVGAVHRRSTAPGGARTGWEAGVDPSVNPLHPAAHVAQLCSQLELDVDVDRTPGDTPAMDVSLSLQKSTPFYGNSRLYADAVAPADDDAASAAASSVVSADNGGDPPRHHGGSSGRVGVDDSIDRRSGHREGRPGSLSSEEVDGSSKQGDAAASTTSKPPRVPTSVDPHGAAVNKPIVDTRESGTHQWQVPGSPNNSRARHGLSSGGSDFIYNDDGTSDHEMDFVQGSESYVDRAGGSALTPSSKVATVATLQGQSAVYAARYVVCLPVDASHRVCGSRVVCTYARPVARMP